MDWAYLAGFTDGDGCITMEYDSRGRYTHSRVRWAQKEASSCVLDEIYSFLLLHGVNASTRNFSVATKGHKYPQRELGLTNVEDSRIVLNGLKPYLILKKKRCDEALDHMNAVAKLKNKYGNKYMINFIKDINGTYE